MKFKKEIFFFKFAIGFNGHKITPSNCGKGS